MFASRAILLAHTITSFQCSLNETALYAKKKKRVYLKRNVCCRENVVCLHCEALVIVNPYGLRESRVIN